MSHAVHDKSIDEEPSIRSQRLAAQLSSMFPCAETMKVRLLGPRSLWPHLKLTAVDKAGRAVPITRAGALAAARWIIRTYPDAGWQSPRTFNLRTGHLSGESA
ncbi:transcriptional regulator [Streptomyces jumonjinensis]|uniref:Transcriptional regulator n=1 Tax=Streptomyces jumonjinensis TaxID=1945 RepID=A0A646KRU4_STRJU|nr:transcriptional regulator [Streptomyces jumonjinensis]MQT05059.1 transcriptional regulator [Streptomyces jumonjinensis]